MLSLSSHQSRLVAQTISLVCGWVYVTLWTISYYPQPLLNRQRQSTEGYAFDYPILNVFGSLCYTTGTTLLYYSPLVRREYALRHPANPEPTVRFNDVVYGLHSVAVTATTLSQFWPSLWGWSKPALRKPSKVTISIVAAGFICLLIAISIAFMQETFHRHELVRASFIWLDVVYTLTYIKLAITLGKYMPQISMNYRRQSTSGFAITGVTQDFVGGLLSLAQLLIDSSLQADWTGLTGNPIKLGLANVSMVADVVFMVQHYVLYGDMGGGGGNTVEEQEDVEREREPLLG
ncbi:Cystinosin [Sphaerulina musiva]